MAGGTVVAVEAIVSRPFAWGQVDERGYVHDAALLALARPVARTS